MKNADVSSLLQPIAKGLKSFHTTIFIVVVVVGLTFAVLTASSIITAASNGTASAPTGTQGGLDTATIERLKSFHTSDQIPAAEELPNTRINPFNE